MKKLRVIGDIHQEYRIYQNIINDVDNSICVGDVGFNYDYLLENVDPHQHRCFGGNHDNYDLVDQTPHFLGDFGEFDSPVGKIFFVRGAWSIDRAWRKQKQTPSNKLIWDEEELSYQQGLDAIEAYKKSDAQIILTHEAPISIVQYCTNPKFTLLFGYEEPVIKTRTNQLLQAILDIRRPKLWCFGHYHADFFRQIDKTLFVCINMEKYIDIYDDGRVYYNNIEIQNEWV